ncbi:MAG: SCO family protein [Rickettsiales bacterium]
MIKFLFSLVVLLLLFTSFTLFVTKNKNINNTAVAGSSNKEKAFIGGEFYLINQDGNVVGDKDFRGQVMLVFFGFTHCPDICPVTAATFASVMESLGDKADMVAPIFITVDPKRDTQEVLKEYLGNIDKRIIGLTGSDEQISKVADVYKTYFAKVDSDKGDDYMVNHSGYVYLMDKNGEYVKHFPYNVKTEELVNSIKILLN